MVSHYKLKQIKKKDIPIGEILAFIVKWLEDIEERLDRIEDVLGQKNIETDINLSSEDIEIASVNLSRWL